MRDWTELGMEIFEFRGVGNGHHTQALGDNIRHNTDYKGDKLTHPILISHTAKPTHVNVYVLLAERGKKKRTKCHHRLSANLSATGKRYL